MNGHDDLLKLFYVFKKKKTFRRYETKNGFNVRNISKKLRDANLIFIFFESKKQLKVSDRNKILDKIIEHTDPKARIFFCELKSKTNWLSVWAGW